MPNTEPKYECPVCLGLKLNKLKLSPELLIDFCSRCGGVWFDHSEVHALRRCSPSAFWKHVGGRKTPHQMRCHSCHAHISASGKNCPVCRWKRVIECPVCRKQMSQYHDLRLDGCRSCRGVWFNKEDLSRIWNGHLFEISKKESAKHKIINSMSAGDFPPFLDVLASDPNGPYLVADVAIEAGGTVVNAAAETAIHAPEVAAFVIEGTADFAGEVFGLIVEIIAGIFSGL